ncbi:hypothetical protein [Nostoc sp.]
MRSTVHRTKIDSDRYHCRKMQLRLKREESDRMSNNARHGGMRV